MIKLIGGEYNQFQVILFSFVIKDMEIFYHPVSLFSKFLIERERFVGRKI